MKYFFILVLVISNCLFLRAQNSFPYKNDDFSAKIINKDAFFEGKSNSDKVFKIKFEAVTKNLKKPENYTVIGVTKFDGETAKFAGEITFKEAFGVRNLPQDVLFFGDFNFNEKTDKAVLSNFKGKIRMQINKDVNNPNATATLTFKGDLVRNNEKSQQIWFSNFVHNDIDKVIFR